MSDVASYLWLIPTLPLLGAAVIAALGPTMLRERSHLPCIGAAAASCLLSLLALLAVRASDGVTTVIYGPWFEAGNVAVYYSMRADGLTAIMLVMITFIGALIATYSIGYMHRDPGYPRFFASFSLFLAFMTGLVLANNFILLYACWEGVGLCSYLLIGFWFAKPAAAAAARKAFLVTRIGDVGMFIGILLLWYYFGHGTRSLEYDRVFDLAREGLARGSFDPYVLLMICLLLLAGAVGKSAQFPLHVWLPDAMEGPSPVSALIHAATMVTAGVYLVARCTPLFALAPLAQETVAVLGASTMLLAALIALTQTDLKRVLAYSTLSQLGYMFLGLGCGLREQNLVTFAVFAAIFHLFTHAFFKALLFLSAGSVMHAMGNVIDMRRFSGLRQVLPTTHWTFFCGAFALAGLPPMSGFWSKDEIIAAAYFAGQHSSLYQILFAMAVLTAGLTSFYTFRAYFMTFWGELKVPPEAYAHAHGGRGAEPAPAAHAHAAEQPTPHQAEPHSHDQVHESPPVMTVPLMVLAIGAVFVGLVLGPTHLFQHFLDDHWMKPVFAEQLLRPGEHHAGFFLLALTIGVAVGGTLLAYWMYVLKPAVAAELARRAPAVYELSRNRFYIDELYDFFVIKPLTALAHLLRVLDFYLVDGLVNLAGNLPGFLGTFLRPVQNGLVQFYALLMILGMTGIMVAVLLR
jgi:proton-translocating NADH-quinone oxidoreductase chain L